MPAESCPLSHSSKPDQTRAWREAVRYSTNGAASGSMSLKQGFRRGPGLSASPVLNDVCCAQAAGSSFCLESPNLSKDPATAAVTPEGYAWATRVQDCLCRLLRPLQLGVHGLGCRASESHHTNFVLFFLRASNRQYSRFPNPDHEESRILNPKTHAASDSKLAKTENPKSMIIPNVHLLLHPGTCMFLTIGLINVPDRGCHSHGED